MDLKTVCPEKVVDAETAIAKMKNGSRVFIGTGCGEPQHLIRAMVEDLSMQDIMVYQMLSWTFSDYVDDPRFLRRFSLKLFFISSSMRKAAFEGKIDYIPTYLSQIPRYFANQRIGLDVALIQVSPPDRHGLLQLGGLHRHHLAGMQNAKMVIAQVNPRMPRTWGDSVVHIDDIDYLVEHEEPLVEALPSIKNAEIASRIGFYVNQLVDDGATLQIGFGTFPMPFCLI
jgi:acyl-CoA hydrolase